MQSSPDEPGLSYLYDPLAHDRDDPETLNALLRSEIAATETYAMAVRQLPTRAAAEELCRIRDEHQSATQMLRSHIRAIGAKADEQSGPWGLVGMVVTGTAATLGVKPLLSALRRGEEHGISEYQKAMNGELSLQCRTMIERELLPMCRRHVAALRGLTANGN